MDARWAAHKGARKNRRRVGRGLGSGRGTTAGKGTKGQKARSGGGVAPYFEGGQLPLIRRLPYRRGFHNPLRTAYHGVNLDDLNRIAPGSVVDPERLRALGLVSKKSARVKVLARGELEHALTVKAHAFSARARAKIEGVGGRAEVIGSA